MLISEIINRAKRIGRFECIVLCDNCGTPASLKYSTSLSWTCCAGCATGESKLVSEADFIKFPGQGQGKGAK